jgi:hypothetical protein
MRVLLFAAELSILVVGIASAFALVYHFQSEESQPLAVAFFGVLFISTIAFVLLRRKSRSWKIALDAANFLRWRSLRRTHPTRAWITADYGGYWSGCPGSAPPLTFFFLPPMTHVILSRRHLVPHYKFVVPLHGMIIKSARPYPSVWVFFSNKGAARYGLTSLWKYSF